MYENGVQLNRYANKMVHQRKMKYAFLNKTFGWMPGVSWEEYMARKKEQDSEEYWKIWDVSRRRAFASRCSRRKIRSEYRQALVHMDLEDMYAPQHSEYKKIYDYWWTIW